MRAIFKAVNGGKQAVLLAPTTVLVEQHANTFSARLREQFWAKRAEGWHATPIDYGSAD